MSISLIFVGFILALGIMSLIIGTLWIAVKLTYDDFSMFFYQKSEEREFIND